MDTLFFDRHESALHESVRGDHGARSGSGIFVVLFLHCGSDLTASSASLRTEIEMYLGRSKLNKADGNAGFHNMSKRETRRIRHSRRLAGERGPGTKPTHVSSTPVVCSF